MIPKRWKFSCACGGRLVFGATPEEARPMMDAFNRNHASCVPGAAQYRCGVCGRLLLMKDRCPMHESSARVEWTPRLAAAYWAVVDSMANGMTPTAPLMEADAYAQAIDLAGRWGGHRVGSLRVRPEARVPRPENVSEVAS